MASVELPNFDRTAKARAWVRRPAPEVDRRDMRAPWFWIVTGLGACLCLLVGAVIGGMKGFDDYLRARLEARDWYEKGQG